jgi:hypothetical protein
MAKFNQDVCMVCQKSIDVALNRELKRSMASQVYDPRVGLTEDDFRKAREKSDLRAEIERALKAHKEKKLPIICRGQRLAALAKI